MRVQLRSENAATCRIPARTCEVSDAARVEKAADDVARLERADRANVLRHGAVVVALAVQPLAVRAVDLGDVVAVVAGAARDLRCTRETRLLLDVARVRVGGCKCGYEGVCKVHASE